MADTFTLPWWVILLIVFGMYLLVLYVKSRCSKKGLMKHDIWVSIAETIGPANALYLLIYVLCLLASGEQDVSSALSRQPFPVAIVTLYLLALVLDFIRVNWKRWKKAR